MECICPVNNMRFDGPGSPAFYSGTDHQTFCSSATSISSMEPSAPYNMVSLADSRALMSGIPSFCKSAVIAVKDHGLHADVPNRRSHTLLDGVPVHPEAHRQPTQMQFANCLPSPCSYSDPNSREPPEPIRHGAAPYNFQDVHIIETSTRDVEVGCKQQALGCKLTRDNDIHHMLEFHDNKMLKHHSGPPSASITHAVDNQIDEYSTCPAIRCLCTGSDGRECLQYINCGVVPAHFKDAHNIKHLTRRRLLDCTWRGCGRRVSRHNYVRHIRERHLEHGRKSVHKKPIRCTIGNNKPGRCTGAT